MGFLFFCWAFFFNGSLYDQVKGVEFDYMNALTYEGVESEVLFLGVDKKGGNVYDFDASNKSSQGKHAIVWLSPDPDNKNFITQDNLLSISLRVEGPEFKKEDLLFINNEKQISNKSGEVTLKSSKVNAEVVLEKGLNEIQLCIGESCSKKLSVNYNPKKPKLHILAIGPDYSMSPVASNLKYTQNDADQFVEKFLSQKGLIYSDVIVKKISGVEANGENIYRQLNYFLKGGISSNDLLMVFISSHGGMHTYLGEKRFFIYGSTYDSAAVPQTSVLFEDISDKLDELKCKKLVFIDACHSGGAKGDITNVVNEAIGELFQGQDGIALFSSSSQTQKSFELDKYKSGAFTKVLLDALDGKADKNKNRKITIKEIESYVKKQVDSLVNRELGKEQSPKLVRCDLDRDLPIYVLNTNIENIQPENDRDGDGLINTVDECPDEPGTTKNFGCPEEQVVLDNDGDGLANTVDECPDEPGLVVNMGCPEEKKEELVDHILVEKMDNEMVLVKGGSFKMGCGPGRKECDDDEAPLHTVKLSSFYISKYEVTQEQWENIMGFNPSEFDGCKQCPVENVSWGDVHVFIKKLNSKFNTTYRLPSEAEWEFASRGGRKTKGYMYSGSNDLSKVGWYLANASKETHEVGIKHPNELGLHDMSGNVWEWCSDLMSPYASENKNNQNGGVISSYRVDRGGSWFGGSKYCRVSDRYGHSPNYKFSYLGFRLASSTSK